MPFVQNHLQLFCRLCENMRHCTTWQSSTIAGQSETCHMHAAAARSTEILTQLAESPELCAKVASGIRPLRTACHSLAKLRMLRLHMICQSRRGQPLGHILQQCGMAGPLSQVPKHTRPIVHCRVQLRGDLSMPLAQSVAKIQTSFGAEPSSLVFLLFDQCHPKLQVSPEQWSKQFACICVRHSSSNPTLKLCFGTASIVTWHAQCQKVGSKHMECVCRIQFSEQVSKTYF